MNRRRPLLLLLPLLLISSCGEEDAAGPRIVPIELFSPDGNLPILEPAITAEETTALREAFDWAATEEVPETDPDGYIALHYVLVFLDSDERRDLLEALEVPHDSLPFFAEERVQWEGRSGVFENFGDGNGLFEFAVMPGRVLNALRDLALDGRPAFTAVVRREAPVPEALNADGSLDYTYLAEHGFRYATDLPPVGSSAGGLSSGGAAGRSEAFIDILIFALCRECREAVEGAVGEIDREVRGNVPIEVEVQVFNADNAFNSRPAEGDPVVPTRMTRAWRGEPGVQPLTLPGIVIKARSSMGMIRTRADQNGRARFELGHGQAYTMCLQMENDAAILTNDVESRDICVFDAGIVPDEPTRFPIATNAWDANLLAQMSDVRLWSREFLGHHMTRRAKILVGDFANLFGEFNNDRAFALCGGYGNPAALGLGGVLSSLAPIAALIIPDPITLLVFQLNLQHIIDTMTSTDIAFPEAGDATTGTHSRLVPSHEYGHFLMCDLLNRQGYGDFAEAIGDISTTILFGGTPTQRPEQRNLVFSEAFADFVASQVVGGMNYLTPDGSDRRGHGSYCIPTADWCIEDNVGGTMQRTTTANLARGGAGNPEFIELVARTTTLLHDAVDGRNTIATGAHYRWNDATSRLEPFGPGTDQRDEAIVAEGTIIPRMFQEWSARYGTVPDTAMFDSLARALVREGFPDVDVCELFALHSPDGECSGLLGEGVLDLSGIPPSMPILESVEVVSDSEIFWTWLDLSTGATSFEVELGAEGEAPSVTTHDYSRRLVYRAYDLMPDTRYQKAIRALNGDLAGPWARSSQVTYARPVISLTATGGRGSVTVEWTSSGASSYVVEMTTPTGEVREAAVTGDTTSHRIGGLASGETHSFRVIALNQVGRRSTPSLPATAVPTAANVVYLSSVFGNDTWPDAGSPAHPFLTLDAALGAAAGGAIDELRIEEGMYSGSAHTVASDLLIEGGYRGTTWAPGTRATDLIFEDLAPAEPCTTADYNTGGVGAMAGLVVEPGVTLAIRTVGLYVRPLTRTGCMTVVALRGGALRATSSKIAHSGTLAPGECLAGVQAVAVGGRRPSVDLAWMTVEGAMAGSSPAAGVHAAGLCADGASAVTVRASDVSGVYLAASLATPHTAPASIIGLTARDIGDLRIGRSMIGSTSPHRRTFSEPPYMWRASAGYIGGLAATASGHVFIDNSIIRTHLGGDQNVAVALGSTGTGPTAVDLYHVNAIAGADWDLGTPVPDSFIGTALALFGDLSGTDMSLINSMFVYAAGGENLSPVIYSAIDRQGVTADPRLLVVEGNVFSVPAHNSRPIDPFALCGTAEFQQIYSEINLDSTPSHACISAVPPADWRATGNRGLIHPPVTGTCMMDCGEGQFCAVSGMCEPRPEGRALTFDEGGRPLPSDALFVYGETGIPLAGLPHAAGALRDRSGLVRDPAAREGAGAYRR